MTAIGAQAATAAPPVPPRPAVLCLAGPAGQPDMTSSVVFQYTPKTIKVSHSAGSSELGVKESKTNDPGQKTSDSTPGVSNLTSQQELEKQGKTSFSLDGLVFDGATKVQNNCGTLLNWSYPLSRAVVTQSGNQAKEFYLQDLIFLWGDFTLGANAPKAMQVTLTSCNVTYDRFSPNGAPIRATVTLSLQPTSQNPTQQNPTSGGLPDRRGRLLIRGDSLPTVAVAEYGRPGEWRTLAEANQLDDPLRVRPGMRLYLPGRAELAGRS